MNHDDTRGAKRLIRLVQEEACRVAVVGLRSQEFLRLRARVATFGLPIDLVNGGHISEGSNASRAAQFAVNRADLVLWNPDGARHFSAGIIPSLHVRRIHGVSGALRAIVEWMISSPGKIPLDA